MKAFIVSTSNKKQYLVSEKQGEKIKELLIKNGSSKQKIALYDDLIQVFSIMSVEASTVKPDEMSVAVKKQFAKDSAKELSAEIKTIVGEPFQKLPTAFIVLSTDLKTIMQMSDTAIERTGKAYVLASCHYTERFGEERQYLIEPSQIAEALFMKPDGEGYGFAVSKIMNYGVVRKLSTSNI